MCQWVQTSVTRSQLRESARLAFDPPMAKVCILSSRAGYVAKLQSLGLGLLSAVGTVLGVHPGDGHKTYDFITYAVSVTSFFFSTVCLSFMLEKKKTCL